MIKFMNKFKKILVISSLSVFVLILSGCGSSDDTKKSPEAPAASVKKQTQEQTISETKTTPTPMANLEPLPTDTKKAVDTEITSIDKEIAETENTLNSADLSDTNLGL
jgi:ABC-type Fe3+-citrate transport system substrate-binding protein